MEGELGVFVLQNYSISVCIHLIMGCLMLVKVSDEDTEQCALLNVCVQTLGNNYPHMYNTSCIVENTYMYVLDTAD